MANWTEELFTIVDAHRSDPPCIVWSIGTVINWTVRSTNQNSRRSSYRRARRIELSPSYGGVTREVKFWLNGPGTPHPSTVG